MTPVAIAGGPAAPSSTGELISTYGQNMRYVSYPPHGSVYRIPVTPRLTAYVEPTDDGFVATCPQLESLGYGADAVGAFLQLLEATQEYLTYLSDQQPLLSPRVAHHKAYVRLLEVPVTSWFAAIGRPSPDAS